MISDFLGIPSDRTDLIIMFCIILGLVILTLIVTFVQWLRKRPSIKIWSILFGTSLFLLIFVFFLLRSTDVPSSAQIEEKKRNEVTEPTFSSQVVNENVSFAEIYRAYKENELRADDVYKNNRYRIEAKVSGMSTDGLSNLTGGATLTMETQVDSTIVFFYAEFEKEQEDALKALNVGDTIIFEGECLSAGTWVDCELITE
ncbi:MAG: hypothetical protein SOZ77_02690 [Candidatus Limousia pullorum]|nr:hypothetical protein [Candidatus Limousia pullorum]